MHTAANGEGEIRGQIRVESETGLIANMTGGQEVPAVTTSASALGIFTLSQNQEKLKFRVTLAGLSSAITAAHFHTGLASQAGSVVFNLVPFFDNASAATAAYGYWKDDNTGQPFTPRRSLQFRRDSMYMNLHTAAFPGGEIRGQVYRGARNLQVVLATQPAAIAAETFGTAPNPFSLALTLAFEARATGAGQLRVTDMLGHEVAHQSVAVRAGANVLPLALPGLAPGLYTLILQVGDTQVTTRIARE